MTKITIIFCGNNSSLKLLKKEINFFDLSIPKLNSEFGYGKKIIGVDENIQMKMFYVNNFLNENQEIITKYEITNITILLEIKTNTDFLLSKEDFNYPILNPKVF
jgi:hypothetical protein